MNEETTGRPGPTTPSPTSPAGTATSPPGTATALRLPNAAPVADEWHHRYLQAQRRSRYLGITAAAAGVVAVIAVIWGVGQGAGSTVAPAAGNAPGSMAQQFGSDGMPGTGGVPGGSGRIDPAAELFAADGSVDTEALAEFLAMTPPDLDPLDLVDRMADDGAVTTAQAEQLRDAIAAAEASGASSSEPGAATDTNPTNRTA